MALVRAFSAGDAAPVADLFMRVFRGVPQPSPGSLRSYVCDVFLGNPWVDAGCPPLVAIDDNGRVVGFLGAIPIPVKLRGDKLVAAVGSCFMIDPRYNDPLAAVRLLRRFLDGGQDLALTDTANPAAIRFWTKLDGHAAPFQAMRWVLAIRPAALGVGLAGRDRRHRLVGAAPVAHLLDRIVGKRLRPPTVAAELCRASVAEVYDVLETISDEGQVGFGGTLGEFEWLLGMLHRRTRFGPVQLLTLDDGRPGARGVVIYFPNRGGIGQVVIATAASGAHGTLVAALRRHAYEQGSVGVMGHADARLALEMRHFPCVYLYRNDFTMLHARDASLLEPLRTGDVALTRLTGEWWTRFQGDVFH